MRTRLKIVNKKYQFILGFLAFVFLQSVCAQSKGTNTSPHAATCSSPLLPDGRGGCCRVHAEVLELLTQRKTKAKLTDLRSNGKGACCLDGYDCPGGGPDVCGNKGPLCGFDIPEDKKKADLSVKKMPQSSGPSQAAQMGTNAGIIQRALRGMSGDNPNLEMLMQTVEALKGKYRKNAEFERAYLSAYQSTMSSMNDQTAMKEAIQLAHQIK